MSAQGQQVITFSARFIALANTALATILEELERLAKESKEYKLLNDFSSYMKEHMHEDGAVDYTVCRSYAYTDLQKKLNEKNIPCLSFLDKETGVIMMATRATDREAIRDAKNELFEQQRKMSRVSVNELNRINANNFVDKIDGLSSEQVKVFQEYAQNAAKGFVMAANKNENGTYTVTYAQKDRESARMAMAKAAESTVGVSGRFQTQRIAEDIKKKEIIIDNLNKNQDFYIVSGINPREYIHVTDTGFDHRRGDKLVRSESRSDERFRGMLYNQMMGVVKPVVLSKEQYEKSSDIDKLVKDSLQKQPMSAIEKHHAYVEARARMLVEAKLSLDNGNQPENLSSFYNGECSFSEFFAHEVVNDEHDEELLKAAAELDNASPDDKKIAMNYTRDVYAEIDRPNMTTELVTANVLAQNIDSFIDEHDSDIYEPNTDSSSHEL